MVIKTVVFILTCRDGRLADRVDVASGRRQAEHGF